MRILTYEIWDKVSDIKGFNAEYWINSTCLDDDDNLILFSDNGIVCYIDKESTSRSNNNLPDTMSLIEVADYLLNKYNIIDSKTEIIELNNADITKALKMFLSGGMQSLAFELYPDDFKQY